MPQRKTAGKKTSRGAAVSQGAAASRRAAEAPLRKWLAYRLGKHKYAKSKSGVREYLHTYRRVRQLMPQMIDFVETVFEKRRRGELHKQLVFLGRGARPFYRIAFRLAGASGIGKGDIKIIEIGRRLTGKIYSSAKIRKDMLEYMQSRGIDLHKPITFIDTGVIGTVPNDLMQLFKIEKLATPVNGYMFYGRDVHHKGVGYYAPSGNIRWALRGFSEREARSLIEELPKPVVTVKRLVRRRGKVVAEYSRSSDEERIGAAVARKALIDAIKELQEKKAPKK